MASTMIMKLKLVVIGVQAKKIGESNKILPKFCHVCPNLDLLELYKYEKKICQHLR